MVEIEPDTLRVANLIMYWRPGVMAFSAIHTMEALKESAIIGSLPLATITSPRLMSISLVKVKVTAIGGKAFSNSPS